MLKGLDPVLSADLLWLLAAMGHGDDLALVDANHPAETIARATTSGKLVRLPGLTMQRAARAILSVLPIDDFEPEPARRMLVVDTGADPARADGGAGGAEPRGRRARTAGRHRALRFL